MTGTWSGACSAQHLLIITGFDLFNACKDKGGGGVVYLREGTLRTCRHVQPKNSLTLAS